MRYGSHLLLFTLFLSLVSCERSGVPERPDIAPVALELTTEVELKQLINYQSAAIDLAQHPLIDSLFYTVHGDGRITIASESGLVTNILHRSPGTQRGIAFDPDFSTNGYIYLHHIVGFDKEGATNVVSRIKTNPLSVDADFFQEEVLIEWPAGKTHNGGSIVFGPDRMLYILTGDGYDDRQTARDMNDLRGKILRIDVREGCDPYCVPPDNPFVDTPSHRAEIWSYGVRNPFRGSLINNHLVFGDLGAAQFDEINVVDLQEQGGENFGWPDYEGGTCQSEDCLSDMKSGALTLPNIDGIALVGGPLYQGSEIPEISNKYLFADFVKGNIFAADFNPDQSTIVAFDTLFHNSGDNLNPDLISSIVSLVPNAQGEIYVVSIFAGVFKLQPK